MDARNSASDDVTAALPFSETEDPPSCSSHERRSLICSQSASSKKPVISMLLDGLDGRLPSTLLG